MSRRYPRIRARLTATVQLLAGGDVLVCATRDISTGGCFLDTAQLLDPGTRVMVAILDDQQGNVIEVNGEVTRCLPPGPDGLGRGVGVRFDQPPDGWHDLVALRQASSDVPPVRPMRLRILVVGDEMRRRGALALYVQSGWDVRFATDVDGAVEALAGVRLSAVIAENELEDRAWHEVLDASRRLQPGARRIVRARLSGKSVPQPEEKKKPLVHRFVDRDAGLDALVDALTADMGEGAPTAGR